MHAQATEFLCKYQEGMVQVEFVRLVRMRNLQKKFRSAFENMT